MPTYTMKAPNGKTYDIQGPPGATEAQVRAEILRRDPSAGKPPAPPKAPPSVASELGRAAYNLPRSTLDLGVDTVKGAVTAVLHPVQTAKAIGDAAVGAVDVAKGGLQAVRELSPNDPKLRGTAPAMDKTAYNATAADLGAKYGTPRRALKTFADDPAAATITAASVVVPPLRASTAGRAVEAAVGRQVVKAAEATSRATAPVRDTLSAGKRGEAAAKTMGGETQAALKAQQAQAAAEAKAAEARAARLRDIAEKARARGNEAFARRADELANAAVPEPDIGTPRNLSEIGDIVRNPALENAEGINTRMREIDDQLRTAMDEVAASRAAEGVGVSDMPLAKEIVKTSRAIVRPDPVARPTVGHVPADSAGGKLHKMVLDTLEPEPVRLDPDMVEVVKAAGGRVVERNGEFYRVIVPSLQNVDDLRRTLGKIAGGELEGYEAINKLEARRLYGQVTDLMDEYAEGTSGEVLANWRLGKKALEPYEKYRMGKKLVGLEKGTNEPALPASSIPGNLTSGGRDAIDQATMVAGQGPVQDALRSIVQNEFIGKNADALENAIAPGTKLGDAIASDDALVAATREYIDKVRAAEQAGAKATDLEKRAATNMGRADKYDKIAEKLTGDAGKSATRVKEIERELAMLEIEEPAKVGGHYRKILEEEHAAGRISDEKYRAGLALSAKAEKAFKDKAKMKEWVRSASWALGAGGAGALAGGPVGFAGGAAMGIGARTMRRSLDNKIKGK